MVDGVVGSCDSKEGRKGWGRGRGMGLGLGAVDGQISGTNLMSPEMEPGSTGQKSNISSAVSSGSPEMELRRQQEPGYGAPQQQVRQQREPGDGSPVAAGRGLAMTAAGCAARGRRLDLGLELRGLSTAD